VTVTVTVTGMMAAAARLARAAGSPAPGRPRRPGAQCQRQAGCSAAWRRWQCSAATALTEPGAAAAQKLRPKQPS